MLPHLQSLTEGDRSTSALIIIPSSPEAAEWQRLIQDQARASGIAVYTASDNVVDPPRSFSIRISDNLDDLSVQGYDEKTVILTQVDTLGSWTGRQRADVSLALSALPADVRLRYITPSIVRGAKSVEITSFLALSGDLELGATDTPVDHALALYREGPLRPGVIYSWAPADFMIDPKHERVDGAPDIRIDLTGRARCLVHGPYVALPKGHWRATVRFSVDDSACRYPLRFEWGPLAQFAAFEAFPDKPGHFVVEIAHDFDEAAICEMRLILPESSLAGILTLEGVDIEMIETPTFV